MYPHNVMKTGKFKGADFQPVDISLLTRKKVKLEATKRTVKLTKTAESTNQKHTYR